MNKIMKKLFVSAAIMSAVFMSSCGTSGNSVDLSGEWNIVSVEGQNISSESDPFIGFDTKEGRIYGNAGCNRIMGVLEIDSVNPGHIVLSNVAATRMMCPDIKTEQKVMAALNSVSGFQSSTKGVDLTDKSGKIVLSLEKREASSASAEVSISSLEGEWIISKVNGAAVEVADKTPFLAFNTAEGRVHGNAGCNIVNGSFQQEEGNMLSIKFGQMISTMMAGPGLETEGKIMEAIGKVNSFAVNEDGSVSLNDVDGKEVVLLTKNNGKSLAE